MENNEDKTLALIKPDTVKAGYAGEILDQFIKAGFTIKGLKKTLLTLEKAQQFYAVHAERSFFESLTEYMASGPIIAAVLSKQNAVADYRNLIGATDPEKAEAGTIRAQYAKSIQANAVHGSDSDENAEREAAFFFSNLEIF